MELLSVHSGNFSSQVDSGYSLLFYIGIDNYCSYQWHLIFQSESLCCPEEKYLVSCDNSILLLRLIPLDDHSAGRQGPDLDITGGRSWSWKKGYKKYIIKLKHLLSSPGAQPPGSKKKRVISLDMMLIYIDFIIYFQSIVDK